MSTQPLEGSVITSLNPGIPSAHHTQRVDGPTVCDEQCSRVEIPTACEG